MRQKKGKFTEGIKPTHRRGLGDPIKEGVIAA